jgi:hypothetical protein
MMATWVRMILPERFHFGSRLRRLAAFVALRNGALCALAADRSK